MADDVVEKKIEELAVFIEDTNRHADITGEYAQEAEDKINEAMGSAIEMENRLDEIERQFTTLINVVEERMVSADAVGLLNDVQARWRLLPASCRITTMRRSGMRWTACKAKPTGSRSGWTRTTIRDEPLSIWPPSRR